MIRKLKAGWYRLYSRKKDAKTGKRRNLGTFRTRAEAERRERVIQFFRIENHLLALFLKGFRDVYLPREQGGDEGDGLRANKFAPTEVSLSRRERQITLAHARSPALTWTVSCWQLRATTSFQLKHVFYK